MSYQYHQHPFGFQWTKYPAGDGTKVEKKVLSLSNPEDMWLVVDGLTDYGFFKKPKSLTDAAKHLYVDGKPEAEVLGELVKGGKLRPDFNLFTI